MGRTLRHAWKSLVGVLRVTFGPTRAASNIWNYWPVLLTALGIVLPLLGLSVPTHLHLAPPLWAIVALGVLSILLFRTAWIFHASTIREFPRAEIEVDDGRWLSPDNTPEEKILMFKIRVTNREPTQKMSLVFDLSFRWMLFGSPFVFRLYRALHLRLPEQLSEPLAVGPQETRDGWLSVKWDWTKEDEEDSFLLFAEWGRFRPKDEDSFINLNVHDYVSGGSADIACPGVWSRL